MIVLLCYYWIQSSINLCQVFSLWNYEASVIRYSAKFFSFFKKENINWEKKRRPDLLKDWKIYYQRVRSIVLMNERKLLYWKHKTLKVYKHKAFKARGNRRHFHSCVFIRTIRLDFVKKFKQPLDGQLAAFILWEKLAWLFS